MARWQDTSGPGVWELGGNRDLRSVRLSLPKGVLGGVLDGPPQLQRQPEPTIGVNECLIPAG
jgi:hypothetical protein